MKKSKIIAIILTIIIISGILLNVLPENSKNTIENTSSQEEQIQESLRNDVIVPLEEEKKDNNDNVQLPQQEEKVIIEEEFFTKTGVNVREAPNTECKIIKVLSINSKVIKIGDDNDWSLIKLDENNTAYIKTSLLSKEKVSIPAPVKKKETKKVSSRSSNSTEQTQQQQKKEKAELEGEGIYLGEYSVTAYCGCKSCSEGYGKSTASGAYPIQGVTIAAPSNFAFGTKLKINGHVYTVQDRGGAIKGNKIDIYFESHSECLKFGRKTLSVYKVE